MIGVMRHELVRLAFESEVTRSLRSLAFERECALVQEVVELLVPVVARVGEELGLTDASGERRGAVAAVFVSEWPGEDGEALFLDCTGNWRLGPSAADGLRWYDFRSVRIVVRIMGGMTVIRRLVEALLYAAEKRRPDDYDDIVEAVISVAEAFVGGGVVDVGKGGD